jgi:hypothetical protein
MCQCLEILCHVSCRHKWDKDNEATIHSSVRWTQEAQDWLKQSDVQRYTVGFSLVPERKGPYNNIRDKNPR